MALGWSLNLGSQALVSMDLPPELAFVTHIGLNLLISRNNIKKSKDNVLDSKTFDTWDDMKAANKGTVTKLVEKPVLKNPNMLNTSYWKK